jgi:hypothetical protein
VRILTDAVDDIVTVDDFLSVSENHILEDVNRCCLALQERDPETLDRIAGAIRGRSTRISGVVACEMENYEPGVYTERVLSKYFYPSLGKVCTFQLIYYMYLPPKKFEKELNNETRYILLTSIICCKIS